MPTSSLLPDASHDPCTLVYCSLLDMLANDASLSALVRPANIVRMIGRQAMPVKESVTDTDLPELFVGPDQELPHIDASYDSGVSNLLLRYAIRISTGDRRVERIGRNGIGASIYPVLWQTFRVLAGWQQAVRQLTYGDPAAKFVQRARSLGCKLSLTNADANRDIVGWSANWRYEVSTYFPTLAIATAE